MRNGFKRLFDFTVVLGALLMLRPVFLAIAVAVQLAASDFLYGDARGPRRAAVRHV